MEQARPSLLHRARQPTEHIAARVLLRRLERPADHIQHDAGKQPGAPGSHLAWSVSPDERVLHFPQGTCACGADLAAAVDLGIAASHQVVDIPLEAATVT